ncbi:hypothetical protein B0H16DRAFT_1728709 [Mycena metata]|uniref:Uncharacterized protein n=1 Tax=Mycena metata TaxID=1033252 RepID=A0AAD7IEQ9_9AGAR|nr:hypothetical protein B0H16DRAFT_1728709 [Mycena metata]
MASSNIETVDHNWLLFEWPPAYRFPDLLDIPREGEAVLSYQCVPRHYAALLDWAYVARNPAERDHTRGLMLMYKHPRVLPNAPRNVIYPVGICVQGFIERCDLKALGSWNKNKEPHAAIQHLVLTGGRDCGHVFRQYKSAINEVLKYIYRALESPPPTSLKQDDSDQLYLTRRVFTKVNSRNRKQPSALEPGDDPMDMCLAVQDNWRILEKLNIGTYMPDDVDTLDSCVAPCSAMVVGEGDFVDVCVGFDIVSRRDRRGGTSIKVHLNIEHVLVLVSGDDTASEVSVEEEEAMVQAPGLRF